MDISQVLDRLRQRLIEVDRRIQEHEQQAVDDSIDNTTVLVELHETRLFLLRLIADIEAGLYPH